MIRTVGWFGQNVFFITYGTYSPAKSCEVAKQCLLQSRIVWRRGRTYFVLQVNLNVFLQFSCNFWSYYRKWYCREYTRCQKTQYCEQICVIWRRYCSVYMTEKASMRHLSRFIIIVYMCGMVRQSRGSDSSDVSEVSHF